MFLIAVKIVIFFIFIFNSVILTFNLVILTLQKNAFLRFFLSCFQPKYLDILKKQVKLLFQAKTHLILTICFSENKTIIFTCLENPS